MDFRFSAPIENDFNTFIGRVDYRFSDKQSVFLRFNIQDDTINAAPQFPGLPSTSADSAEEQRVRHRSRRGSPSLVNSFRYGLTTIDDATVGS